MFNSLSIRYRFIIPVALIVILSITVSALWTTRQVRVGAHRAAAEKTKNDLKTAETLLDKWPGATALRPAVPGAEVRVSA
ncbi:hypothetical protein ACP3TJ_04365 [Desulforudis sp. 1088]|uniref:hypothetical protein n=1 Tax=unclassified Candidatus Desulforudis TaxID=2635950 RepID=UPI003CE5302F